MDVEMISIGKFSEITRLSKKALYCYEKKGLLVPVKKDICSGYRYYNSEQIENAIWIGSLINLGFSLDQISLILSENDKNSPLVRKLFQECLTRTNNEIRRLEMVRRILSSKNPFEELFKMELLNWKIKEVPANRVISINGEGIYNEIVSELIGKLCEEISIQEKQNSQMKVSGPVMVIYTGDCDDMKGTMEAAIPVTGTFKIKNSSIRFKNLPAAKVLSVIHKGPYMNLGMAHKKIFDYCQENNLELSGLGRELYLNNPHETSEEDLMTEIQYSIQ
ncbi:MerR family transcriptional regulator [Methanoplanus sp. FWC-SCC4]|uniref:MerR family transcriptional regulator n=1 Tax=Methanochimaera problematica TaxID=2609417 RepID=A0AA97FB47_9EURY|nr:MerR family transcriptional regulator [Methanoplanus sp. FWC-SCC4]WOF16165.1 MerR family transcriptional regulator [Methanoplanus sp. FWC-SCC4]